MEKIREMEVLGKSQEPSAECQEERAHALLGASSSHRWLHCPPSARAEEKYPDSGSEYAEEGSLAHAIAARNLKERFGRNTESEDKEIAELGRYKTGEMVELTADYADYVMTRFNEAVAETPGMKAKPQLLVEHRIDYSDWVPEGFGTGDAIIISHDTIEIIDFKYGKGVAVAAEENPQMMLYALGAIDEFEYAYNFSKITLTIYQPRIGNISSWETTPVELQKWGWLVVKPTALLAWQGLGNKCSGEWCRFCKAKGECGRLAIDSLGLYELAKEEIDNDDLGGILEQLPLIKDWVKAIEERSMNKALNGERIPGFKLVEGRSVRTITDVKSVIAILASVGYQNEQLFKPVEPRSLTELEKLVGAKRFKELCGQWVEKPQGKPTLVPVSDKRKELNAASDFDDIEI